jgi:hypothetical protein
LPTCSAGEWNATIKNGEVYYSYIYYNYGHSSGTGSVTYYDSKGNRIGYASIHMD